MPFSDSWSRSQLRTAVREEILDPTGTKPWSWTDTELNTYIDWWQQDVQNQFEFTWATATATLTTAVTTLTRSNIATDILRLDAVYFDNKRLTPKSVLELEMLRRDWRNVQSSTPVVVYQQDFNTISFWPPPSTTGTLVFEYPATTTFGGDGVAMVIPPFTKYSVVNYGAERCYSRFGPNQDISKARRYKLLFAEELNFFIQIKNAYQPEKFLSLRPGGKYEKQILQPEPTLTGVTTPQGAIVPIGFNFVNEVPSGTIDGINTIFTLPTATPNPVGSLLLFLDGVLLTTGTHYTLSGQTITLITPFQPISGQKLFATYRY